LRCDWLSRDRLSRDWLLIARLRRNGLLIARLSRDRLRVTWLCGSRLLIARLLVGARLLRILTWLVGRRRRVFLLAAGDGDGGKDSECRKARDSVAHS
jgi:hypothetical protein